MTTTNSTKLVFGSGLVGLPVVSVVDKTQSAPDLAKTQLAVQLGLFEPGRR